MHKHIVSYPDPLLGSGYETNKHIVITFTVFSAGFIVLYKSEPLQETYVSVLVIMIVCEGMHTSLCLLLSLVPRLSQNANMYHVESLVSFVRKHDVIKIGQKQKATFCTLFNQLCFNARCV